jgi:hypothetical protein
MEFSSTDSARELQEITHASTEREEVSDVEPLHVMSKQDVQMQL